MTQMSFAVIEFLTKRQHQIDISPDSTVYELLQWVGIKFSLVLDEFLVLNAGKDITHLGESAQLRKVFDMNQHHKLVLLYKNLPNETLPASATCQKDLNVRSQPVLNIPLVVPKVDLEVIFVDDPADIKRSIKISFPEDQSLVQVFSVLLRHLEPLVDRQQFRGIILTDGTHCLNSELENLPVGKWPKKNREKLYVQNFGSGENLEPFQVVHFARCKQASTKVSEHNLVALDYWEFCKRCKTETKSFGNARHLYGPRKALFPCPTCQGPREVRLKCSRKGCNHAFTMEHVIRNVFLLDDVVRIQFAGCNHTQILSNYCQDVVNDISLLVANTCPGYEYYGKRVFACKTCKEANKIAIASFSISELFPRLLKDHIRDLIMHECGDLTNIQRELAIGECTNIIRYAIRCPKCRGDFHFLGQDDSTLVLCNEEGCRENFCLICGLGCKSNEIITTFSFHKCPRKLSDIPLLPTAAKYSMDYWYEWMIVELLDRQISACYPNLMDYLSTCFSPDIRRFVAKIRSHRITKPLMCEVTFPDVFLNA